MKICTRCNIEKDDSDYRIRRDKYKEKEYTMLNSTCRKCDAELSREYYKKKKNDPEFIKKSRERARGYKNKNYEDVVSRRKTAEYLKKHNEWEKKRYHKYKDFINERAKIKRATPEYKDYVKQYRQKRKEIIYEQEKITKKRYHEKHRDNVTKEYCFHLLRTQGIEIKEETLTQKQIEVIIDRIMKRLAELEKGTSKTCIMCNKIKSVKFFKRTKRNRERINTCNQCIYKSSKTTKYERYKSVKKPSV